MVENEYYEKITYLRNHTRERSGLKLRQYNYDIHAVEPREGQEEAFNAIAMFENQYVNGYHPIGLLLVGGVGSGKTFMVSSLINNFINNLKIYTDNYGKPKDIESSSVYFISTVELAEQLRYYYAKSDIVSYSLMDEIKNKDVLVLDDLGAEKTTEWMCEKLFEIIDFRYNKQLPLVVTTNCLPKEIKSKIGARSYDRLREMCALVSIAAKSQRVTASL